MFGSVIRLPLADLCEVTRNSAGHATFWMVPKTRYTSFANANFGCMSVGDGSPTAQTQTSVA